MIEGVLLRAAREAAARLVGADGAGDAWPEVARLYCAAVEQMASVPARGPEPLDPLLFRPLWSAPDDRRLPLAESGLRAAVGAILEACTGADASQRADVACALVEQLGRPLYRRLMHLLHMRDGHGAGPGLDGLFRVELADARYVLVLAAYDVEADAGSLGASLVAELPAHGWDAVTTKVLPPLVRPLRFDAEHPPAVYYLDAIDPAADRRLGALRADEGLGVAAIPLHPGLRFAPQALPGSPDQDGHTRFRMAEPAAWPADWTAHLRARIRQCSAARVAVAALPELSGSPEVERVARAALAECDNGFPVLLCLGSWHTDVDGGFCNRSAIIARLPGGHCHPVLVHDKFEPFIEPPYVEGHAVGRSGLSFLVSRAGLFAFGICKDWYFQRATLGPLAADQLNRLCPSWAICPAMTGSPRDLHQLAASRLKGTRTALVMANACGTVRGLRDKPTCVFQRQAGGTVDLRSAILAPSAHFTVEPIDGLGASRDGGGVHVVQAACACLPGGGCAPGGNAVVVRLRVRRKRGGGAAVRG